ncbi:MAG: hypothetical protein ACLFP4_16735 [Spirochaetales bacterium]
MSKRSISLVIVALCCVAIGSAYEPLTEAEAREYVERFPAEAAEDVQALDRVEHEEPELELPTYNVIVIDDEILLIPRSPLTVTVGHLGWEITLPEQRAAYEPESLSYIAVGVASFAVGALAAMTAVLMLR